MSDNLLDWLRSCRQSEGQVLLSQRTLREIIRVQEQADYSPTLSSELNLSTHCPTGLADSMPIAGFGLPGFGRLVN